MPENVSTSRIYAQSGLGVTLYSWARLFVQNPAVTTFFESLSYVSRRMKLVLFFAKARGLVWQDPPRRAWGFGPCVLRAPVTDLFDFFLKKRKKLAPEVNFFFGFFPRQHLVEIWARRQKFTILWRSLACKMTR